MAGVELTNILTAQLLHHASDVALCCGSGEQMHMVVHEHIGMQPNRRLAQGICQEREVAPPILVVKKARQAVVAPLDDMLWNLGQIQTGKTSHARSLLFQGVGRNR